MIHNLATGSRAVFIAENIIKKYCQIEDRIEKIYLGSLAHRYSRKLANNFKRYFHFSFTNKISNIKVKEKNRNEIIDKSVIVGFLASIVETEKGSSVIGWLKAAWKKFNLITLKEIGIIIIISALTNIILAAGLGRSMGLWSWFINCTFLFIGFAGLSSDAQWGDIKTTSVTIRLLNFFYGTSPKR